MGITSARLVGFFFAAIFSVTGFSQPSIESLSLDASAGTAVLSGSGFGQGPNVYLYDSFDGSPVAASLLSPERGAWYEVKGTPVFNRQAPLSGNQSMVVRDSSTGASVTMTFGIPDSSAPNGLKMFQEIYYSYSVKDLGDFPGINGTTTSFSTVSSSKSSWLMFGARGDNTAYASTLNEIAGHDLVTPSYTGAGFQVVGNNTLLNPSFPVTSLTNNWSFGGWNTIMFHAKLDPSNPYGPASGFLSFVNRYGYFIENRSGNLMSDQSGAGVPYPYWDRVKFFSWLRTNDSNVQRVTDDIYVAVGPNAAARVLAADSRSLGQATKIRHLLPITWSEGVIELDLNASELMNGTWYLFVLNADGSVSNSLKFCPLCPVSPSLNVGS